MQWSDRAVVLSLRKYGESSGILTVLTEHNGLYSGMIRSAFGKNQGLYQPGNMLEVSWKARMPEHLGNFQCELMESVAARVLDEPLRLLALRATASLLEQVLPEREVHTAIFSAYVQLLINLVDDSQDDTLWLNNLVRLELELLAELGFGLDLSICAATGNTENLCYVSPKTGRAVSEEAGKPYHDKLLALPGFLRDCESNGLVDMQAIQQGLKVTGYFLNRYMFLPRNKTLPEARGRLVEAVSIPIPTAS